MEAFDCLLGRRSIRKYKDTQISKEDLDKILEAATFAPTAMGTQSPMIVCVQNKEDIALMSKLNAQVWGKDIDPFYNAPTVVVVFGDSTVKNCVQDASLVLGNMMNAAEAAGVGSCWINRAKETFELEQGKELMKKWGIDEKYVGVGNCILGYADCEKPVPIARKNNYIKFV